MRHFVSATPDACCTSSSPVVSRFCISTRRVLYLLRRNTCAGRTTRKKFSAGECHYATLCCSVQEVSARCVCMAIACERAIGDKRKPRRTRLHTLGKYQFVRHRTSPAMIVLQWCTWRQAAGSEGAGDTNIYFCMFVSRLHKNYWTNFHKFWYRDNLDLGE